jgi:vancomycin permeability regulator SanA
MWWRRGLIGVALLAAYLLATLVQVVVVGRQHAQPPVDALVVMGAAQYDGRPSPQLAARLDAAVALWSSGGVEWIIVTGGSQPGDRFTEAAASHRYLVDAGVPAAAILAEDSGTTTYESMQGVAELVVANDITSVVVVTDPHHALRSRMIAERSIGGTVTVGVSSTTTSVITGWASARRHVVEAAGVAVGRIAGFRVLSGAG